ncbi:MAG: UvrB/UvrC motif-containing protein [Bacteroidales bacterium]
MQKLIDETRARMKKAAADLDFIEAASLRDEMFALEKQLKS